MLAVLKSRHVLWLLALASLFAIVVAWGYQMAGYLPCELCLKQRIPYYVNLPLSLLALWTLHKGYRGVTILLFLVIAVLFAYGCGIGVYQAGAQWGFWKGPDECSGGAMSLDASSLANTLKHVQVISCTEITWTFLGLSFAAWNAIASAVLTLLTLLGLRLNRR